MSKALEAAARAMCVQGAFDPDELTPNDVVRWKRYVPQAQVAITAYLRAVSEDFSASWKIGEAIERAVEPETGRTDYGGPIPSPSPATKARAALSALEPKDD